MIHVRDLTVRYGDFTALNKVTFDLAAGQCLVVTGMSGCGKSTLARVLSGLIPQAIPATLSGTVEVAGIDPISLSPSDSAQKIGSVFQNPSRQLFHLRVEDEVAFGPYNLGLSQEEIKSRVDWALAAVGLKGCHQRAPTSLSGGQMQRLAIAAALAMKPQVMVLDEPTASLDAAGTHALIATLNHLRKEDNLTIVIVEHRLAELRHLADHVMVLHQGCQAVFGPFGTILNDRNLLRRYGLRRPTMEPLAAWEELLTSSAEPPPEQTPLLVLKGVSAGYDGKAVIRDVDLKFFAGEFVALVGDNGSGKSTLALAAAGLIRPMQGEILFRGHKRPRPGLDVALLFQDPTDQLFTNSVDEEIAFGPRNYRQFDPTTHRQTLSDLDLQELSLRQPVSLSMGQQQRTTLAACLALRPHLVILDEPTLGQDWWHLQQLMEFLHELNRQGTAIVLITHDYKLVYRYAQRVVMLKEGRLALNGRIASNGHQSPKAINKESLSLAS